MAEKNGTSDAIKVITFAAAILGSAITIYSVFHAPLAKAIAEETSCRQVADTKLSDALTEAIVTQQKTNEVTNVLLAKIVTKLEYIEKK